GNGSSQTPRSPVNGAEEFLICPGHPPCKGGPTPLRGKPRQRGSRQLTTTSPSRNALSAAAIDDGGLTMRLAVLSVCVCAVALARPAARAAAQWEPVGLGGSGGSGGIFALAVSPLDPRLMMVNCDMGAAYVSRDAGRTWQMIHHRMLHGNTRCCPVYHPTIPNRLYAVSGGTNEIRVSDDAGTNWRPLTKTRPPWSAPVVLLYVPPDRPDCLVVGAGEAAYVTHNAGATWQRCEGVTGKVVGVLAGRAKKGYHLVATSVGIFRSTDLTKGYAPCRTGLPPGAI